jgi:hypothetical protein
MMSTGKRYRGCQPAMTSVSNANLEENDTTRQQRETRPPIYQSAKKPAGKTSSHRAVDILRFKGDIWPVIGPSTAFNRTTHKFKYFAGFSRIQSSAALVLFPFARWR